MMTLYFVNNTELGKDIFIKDNFVYIRKGNTDVKVYDTNDERLLLGDHNLSNILFAFMVVDILGFDMKESVKVINNFGEGKATVIGKGKGHADPGKRGVTHGPIGFTMLYLPLWDTEARQICGGLYIL